MAPDAVLIVGDVIYPPADDASYDPRFFAPYRALLPATSFYGIPGNHDYEILATLDGPTAIFCGQCGASWKVQVPQPVGSRR